MFSGEALGFHCLLEGPELPASASQMPEPPSAPTRALSSFLKIFLPFPWRHLSHGRKGGREGGREEDRLGPFPEYLLCARPVPVPLRLGDVTSCALDLRASKS